MNRLLLTFGIAFSASSLLLLMDSAIKGTVLLALAAVAALLLRRDSAATRHLVWMMAIVALLIVPVMSATLPQWRVLPTWASTPMPSVATVQNPSLPRIEKSKSEVIEMPQRATSVAPIEVAGPIPSELPPVTAAPVSQSAIMTPSNETPEPNMEQWNWTNVLPLVWAIGCTALLLRLSAARWMLWNSERFAVVIGTQEASQLAFAKRNDSSTAQDPIIVAMALLCSQLKIRRPITLLMHPNKTIPVVWGIFRCRLMLPAAARQWSDEQLQSVLLHELAHIKRGDTLVQLLTQVACALYWFNPLVWFAAWRLDVERERSCDDLVLASGIRPSAYAAHLLDVVSGLSPARWTHACGLAMARKSSIEGRLTAVLGKDLNRRGVSVALAGLIIATVIGIAVPIAMLRAADDDWNPPQVAHVGSNDFNTYCVHDGKETSYVIVYHGDLGSANGGWNNAKLRTWHDESTLTLLDTAERRVFTIVRDHAAADKLVIDGKDYDLAKGRVFVLSDNGDVSQLEIVAPVVSDQASAKKFATAIAAVSPKLSKADRDQDPKDQVASEKATLTVKYDMPGAEAETRIHVERIDPQPANKDWRREEYGKEVYGGVSFSRLKNGESLTLDNLPEGRYRISRYRQVDMVRQGEDRAMKEALLDPQVIELAAGETKSINMTRPSGRSISGSVRFPALWQVNTLVVHVCNEKVGGCGTLKHPDVRQFDLLNAVQIEEAGGARMNVGDFKTEPLPPGRYKVVVEGYANHNLNVSGIIAPSWEGSAEVTIAESQEPAPVGITLNVVDREKWFDDQVASEKATQEEYFADPPPQADENEPFTAWGNEVGGLQAGLGFKAGAKRAYTHGDWATLVVRVRNVGKEEVKFQYLRQFFAEQPPTVFNENGELKQLRGITAFGIHIPVEVKLAAENEIELYELQIYLGTENEEGIPKYPYIFGTGKFQVQYEKVVGNSSSGSIELDPVLSKLATGKLELEVMPNVVKHQAVPTSGTLLKPDTVDKLKWGEPVNGLRMALAWPPNFDEEALGKKPHFQLVVQNVSEQEIRFSAGEDSPNPRELNFLVDERIVTVIADEETMSAEWQLKPGQCGVLRMFLHEGADDHGKTLSAGIEGDLSMFDDHHAVAEMVIAKAPEGAWTGKLITGRTRGSAERTTAPAPMHEDARALYEVWQRYARANGDIPGALVGELASSVRQFITYNPTWETVPKLHVLLPRLEAARDWKPADAIALLDEVAAIQDSPLSMALDLEFDRVVRTGKPLPKELAEALGMWGPFDADGLRVAWELQPRHDLQVEWAKHVSVSSTAAFGEALKARLLLHNSGKTPIVVRVPTFLQCQVKASDAAGKEVECVGISWTTMSRLYTCRLAPGEYVEIMTPGIGFGKDAGRGPWAGPRVGWNVLTQPGGSVRLEHAPVPLDGSESGIREDAPFADGPNWWPACIKVRLARELPLPVDKKERARLLERAANDLFGGPPTDEELDAFAKVADDNSLTAFANQLAQRPGLVSFYGKLRPFATWFKIAEADANADQQPRVVLGPGEYPLPSTMANRGDATLKIVGKPVDGRRTSDAQILFEPTEATGKLPPDPYKLEVPDGWGTWAIVCRPTDDYFYVLHNGKVRKIDYSDPRNVTDTPTNDLPAAFQAEVIRQLDILEISAEQQAEIFEKPAPPASVPDSNTYADVPAKPTAAGATEVVMPPSEEYITTGVHCQKFIEEDAKRPDGRLMGHILNPSTLGDDPLVLGLRVGNDAKWNIGSEVRVELVVRNQSTDDVKFAQTLRSDVGLSVVAIDKDGQEHPAWTTPVDTGLLFFNRWLLPKNGYVATVKSFAIRFDAEERFDSELNVAVLHLPPGDYKLRCKWSDASPDVAHEGEWVGELVNEELSFTLTDGDTPQPASETPKFAATELQLQASEQEPFTAWGSEVGGLQAGLGFKAGAHRAHHHDEIANIVLRVRNVGNDALEFKHIRAYLVENPPSITDADGKPVDLPRYEAMGIHGAISPKIEPGQVVELYEWEYELKPDTPRLDHNFRFSTLYGKGKFNLQCERIVGPTRANPNDPNPAMSKLATGKLELEVRELENAISQQKTPQPKSVAMIEPATEQKLKWGEPVNGLRMALAWPPVLGEPGLGNKPEFYLVVQNVSEKEVRLMSNDAVPNPRMLNLYDTTIVSRSLDDVTIPGDWLLQPREVAFVRLFHAEQQYDDGRTTSILKENIVRTLGKYSYTAEMTIETAPAGAWTGTLVTGATRCSADMLEAGTPIELRSAPPMSWGVPKDGLSGAMRIIGELSPGQEAKAELWVQNSSEETVKFSWTTRADVGLSIVPNNGSGTAREAHMTRDKLDFQLHFQPLPPGHAVKLKEFTIRLASPPTDGRVGIVSLELTPGDWTLQANWTDTLFMIEAAQEWRGELKTGEIKLNVTPEGATVVEVPKQIPESVKSAAPATPASPAALDPTREHPKTETSNNDDTPSAETPPPPVDRKDTKILPLTERTLKWGEPVNGLRGALVMAPGPGEPEGEDNNDIFLAVQNVTKAEVWLHASEAAPNPRRLIWRDKGVLETVTEVAKPIPADLWLQPGEVTFFRMTHPPGKGNQGARTAGSLIEEYIRKDPTFSLEGSMEISTAPVGAWSGKLVTGRTEGGSAIPALQ